MVSRLKLSSTEVRNEHINGLDGLRTIAFLLVFVAHLGVRFIPAGLGVTIFFFLSGYLITTLLCDEFARSSSVSIRNFFVRRAFRILPALYVSYGVILALHWLVTKPTTPVSVYAIFSQLLFASNYFTILIGESVIPIGSGVLWSLAVEEHFYLIWPFSFLLIVRKCNQLSQLRVIGVVCILVLIWRAILVANDATDARVFAGTDTRIDSILWGCLLGLQRVGRGGPKLKIPTWGLVGSCISLILLAFLATRVGSKLSQTVGFTLQGLAIYPIFVVVLEGRLKWLLSILDSRLFREVGVRTYALYLVHHAIIFALKAKTQNIMLICGLAFLLSLVIAECIRRFVELPSLAYRNYFLIGAVKARVVRSGSDYFDRTL
jgi:peptidoglycan/LPS O-acetylase OafA/YrhL